MTKDVLSSSRLRQDVSGTFTVRSGRGILPMVAKVVFLQDRIGRPWRIFAAPFLDENTLLFKQILNETVKGVLVNAPDFPHWTPHAKSRNRWQFHT